MADRSAIEWTDATWNPIVGCSVVSPGCKHCYAMRLAGGRLRNHPSRRGLTRATKAGPVWTGEVRFDEKALGQPLRWRRPRRIFVCAHGDLFHESVRDAWIGQVFVIMASRRQHQFQVLTKRSACMRDYLTGRGREAHRATWHPDEVPWPLANVLLGVSVEDQRRADERRPALAALAAAGWATFASYEPALEPVDWTGWEFLRQLISGGESGPGARPSHPECHRRARDFCAAHGIAYFFKQWGAWSPVYYARPPEPGESGPVGILKIVDDRRETLLGGPKTGLPWVNMRRVGKRAAGAVLDGREHREFPSFAARAPAPEGRAIPWGGPP